MADDKTQNPFMDMFQNFGQSMNIPGPDLDTMMEYHRKNLQALQSATQIGSTSAQAAMTRQRESLEKTLADISETVQSTSLSGDASGMMTNYSDLARRTFDTTVETTRDVAEIMRQGSTESFEVVKERVMSSVNELSGKKQS